MRLTPTELEIELLLCKGFSPLNIALQKDRSIETIQAQMYSIYQKRGVHTRIELLLAFLKRKGIDPFEKNSKITS